MHEQLNLARLTGSCPAEPDRHGEAAAFGQLGLRGQTRQMLTEGAAIQFASLALRLRSRGHDAQAVAHFVNRLVFCMFAEDVDLLPGKMFTRMIEAMERPLSATETALIKFIAAGSLPSAMLADLHHRLVREMDDGRMGSLQFVGAADRSMGSTVAHAEFEDADGVPVSVALLLDQEGRLFELDIWKVDFSPLIRTADVTLFRAAR
ncbi:MAG: DUF6984 family protein [Brevundimonas sp.]|uniref:DUF6984 family protein n=1 Tax=Brevundimonas sp. TaxID=1871086 RepID=UPI00391D316E